MDRRAALRKIFYTSLGAGAYVGGLYPIDDVVGLVAGKEERSAEESAHLLDGLKSIAPNASQLSFLERVASQHDFVGLGDNGHYNFAINLFALHPNATEAMVRGGKRTFFLERSPEHDHIFSDDLSEEDFLQECSKNIRSSWFSEDLVYDAMCENMNASMRDSGMDFVAIDQRFAGGTSPFEKGNFVQRALGYPAKLTSRFQEFVVGRRSILSPSVMISMTPYILSAEITNDRPTAHAMLEHSPDGGVVLFGSKHFDENKGWSFSRQDMPFVLREAGRSVCVVNIMMNDRAAKKRDHSWNHADADLYVFPSEDNPSGIRIYNPNLKPVLESALSRDLG